MGRGVVTDTRVKKAIEDKPVIEQQPIIKEAKVKPTITVTNLPTLSNSKITKNKINEITIIPMG